MELHFKEFLLITQKLNEHQITPLLLGSLGLSYRLASKRYRYPRSWRPTWLGWAAPDKDRLYNWQTNKFYVIKKFVYKKEPIIKMLYS